MKKCPQCNRIYQDNDFYCLNDNCRLVNYSQEQSFKDQEERLKQSKLQNYPKCPTCGSTNLEKISATKRVIGVSLLGFASSNVGKTFHCKNCGYKW